MSAAAQDIKSAISGLASKVARAASISKPKYKFSGEYYEGPVSMNKNRRRSSLFGKKTPMGPPKAPVKPSSVIFGVKEGEDRGEDPMNPPIIREDPYFWLRDDDRKDLDVLGYLQAENDYTTSMTSHLSDQTEAIFQDFLHHIKETDSEVPYIRNGYEYYSRTVKGLSYPIYCRKAQGAGEDGEKILIDLNVEAKGLAHCDMHEMSISPDNTLMAFTLDSTGNEKYTVHIRNIETGKPAFPEEELPKETEGTIFFGKDNNTIFYATIDEAHRPHKLWMRKIGEGDTMLLEENDTKFTVHMQKSLSGRFIFAYSWSSETHDVFTLDLDNPSSSELVSFTPREFGLRYTIDHVGDWFYIVSNADGAKNQKLSRCPVGKTSKNNWEDVFAYDEQVTVSDVSCFQSFLVLEGRQGGFTKLWILDSKDPAKKGRKAVEFPEQVSTASLHRHNYVFDTETVRLSYSSLITPPSVFEYAVGSGSLKLLKEKPALHYNREEYESMVVTATARDGTKVPMSVVQRKDLPPGPNPMYLSGYGSYGICNDPEFRHSFITMLNAGVVVAVAHIRGGGELGRTWYEDGGKYLDKKNTFTDFVDCAKHMVDSNRTSPDKLCVTGRSAGGLLMGAVVNLSPELFKACVAGVPFVDVINTMSDPSIPLTTGEWEEWGNPNNEKYFEYMKSYSPYDNLEVKSYPAMLVTGGLHDPRVAYWEPAKWVAKMRTLKTDSNPLLLKIDLESGHFSASDKYKFLRERAFEYSFIFEQLDVKLNGAVPSATETQA